MYNSGGTITLKNSIISNPITDQNCGGDPIIDGGGNLTWPSSDTTCAGVNGDPKLGPLVDNGGLTRTLALQPGSAAIDAGDDSICAAAPISNTSQNGVTRPYGSHCDIGAFEADYMTVSAITLADPNPTKSEFVNFKVTFSEPVTGVNFWDFTLTTTGVSNAKIISVTGSAAIYTVRVRSGSGSGTIRLDVIDDDSIKAVDDGTPLGFTGEGNGNYTDGEVYTIDRIPPKVNAITRLSLNPNVSANIVEFEVTFSETVSGVDMSDFRLTSMGLTGTAMTGLQGNADTYTVSVNTGIGDGTIRLDLADNDSILDLAGNPLGGPGAGNGDYFTGEFFTIIDTPIFEDVLENYWAFEWIQRLYNAGITTGCSQSPLRYCPEQAVTRAEMAIFLERSKGTFNPPQGTGIIFADVSRFDWYVDWVELLYADEITTGCATNPLSFCPNKAVTRAEMAVFLLRTKYGADFEPPAASGYFADVHQDNYWAADYIEQLYQDGITTGCGGGNFCPERPVTRAEMAAFIMRAFDLD